MAKGEHHEAEGDAKHLAQMCVMVPSDAKPGETQLSVYIPSAGPAGQYSFLQVQVPEQVVPRQTMVLTKFQSGWVCGIAKIELPESITATIPSDAIPGVSEMAMFYRGLEVTRVEVPQKAKPGIDELQADRPSNPSEPWPVTLRFDPDFPELVQEMATGAAQAALRAPPLDANIAYKRLVEAVMEAGGYVNPKMTRGRAPPLNIPGIVAVEDIAKGEIICKIPKGLHLSPFTVEAYAPEIWRGIMPQGIGQRSEEAALYAIGARLLQEAEDRAVARHQDPSAQLPPQSNWLGGADAKTRKVWEAYMDQLLGEDFTHHPIRRVGEDKEAMKALLQPSCMATHLYKEAKCMRTLWRLVDSRRNDLLGERFESGFFLRAMLNFQSRQFKAAVSRSLVPVSDLLNHAPLKDMCVQWGYNEAEEAHMLTAVKDISAGQELLQSYGNHPNASFYRCYNFTLPPQKETSWCYSLWRDDLPTVFNDFVPSKSGAMISEVHLNSGEVSESLRNVLQDIAQNGGNPAFFLRVACTKCIQPYEENVSLRPVLESLKRVRAKEPSSNAWWQDLKDSDKGLVDEEAIRLQMSEYLCLTAHLEAIGVVSGELREDGCLFHAYPMRTQLTQHILQLYKVHQFE